MISATLEQLAYRDFERAAHKAFWRDLVSRLSGKSNHLLSFEQASQGLPLSRPRNQGLQVVAIDKIVGSVGRYKEFDRAFFPRYAYTKERWVSIDKACYRQISLPPVKLIKVGEVYIVRDGNHRISVARARGQEFIDAYVTEFDAPTAVEGGQSGVSGLPSATHPGHKAEDLTIPRER
jgi:hypothetical protein